MSPELIFSSIASSMYRWFPFNLNPRTFIPIGVIKDLLLTIVNFQH